MHPATVVGQNLFWRRLKVPRIFAGVQRQHLSGFQLLCRGHSSDPHVWSIVAVCPEPSGGLFLHFFNAVNVIPPEPFRPDRSVVTCDVCVLLRLARLTVYQATPCLLRPCLQPTADALPKQSRLAKRRLVQNGTARPQARYKTDKLTSLTAPRTAKSAAPTQKSPLPFLAGGL